MPELIELAPTQIGLASVSAPNRVVSVHSVGTVRDWHHDEGWGVIDSPDTPGGCWLHFSQLWNDGIPEAGPDEVIVVSGGYREVFDGETVDFDWETPGQDGYDFRATTARPRGRQAPHRVIRRYRAGELPNFVSRHRQPNGPTQQLDEDQNPA